MDQEHNARYCLKCSYDLRSLRDNRCPECGADFDPSDPTTFRRRPRGARWHDMLRRACSPWIVLPAVWLTYYEIVSGYLLIPLVLFGVGAAAAYRRPVAVILILIANPLTLYFARGALDYAGGTAKLSQIGLGNVSRGAIDPVYRCEWKYLDPKVGSAERACYASYDAAVKLAVHVFGPMPGAYTGPYPSPADILAALKNARPVNLDQLTGDLVVIDSTTVVLDEGLGERCVKRSIWSRAWSELLDLNPSAERPPIAASLTPDGCLVLSVPVRPPDSRHIEITVLVVDPISGRPFLQYRK